MASVRGCYVIAPGLSGLWPLAACTAHLPHGLGSGRCILTVYIRAAHVWPSPPGVRCDAGRWLHELLVALAAVQQQGQCWWP